MIRTIHQDDAVALVRHFNHTAVRANLRDGIPLPYQLADAHEFIKGVLAETPERTFAIDLNGELIGVIGLVLFSQHQKRYAELGYWLAYEYWGKGYTSNALSELLIYAATLHLTKIKASVFSFNEVSKHLLQKHGFELTHIKPKSIDKAGFLEDEWIYEYHF